MFPCPAQRPDTAVNALFGPSIYHTWTIIYFYQLQSLTADITLAIVQKIPNEPKTQIGSIPQ